MKRWLRTYQGLGGNKFMIKWIKSLFNGGYDPHLHEGVLIKEAGECEQRAAALDKTNPYMAGVWSGRADILRRWAYDIRNW